MAGQCGWSVPKPRFEAGRPPPPVTASTPVMEPAAGLGKQHITPTVDIPILVDWNRGILVVVAEGQGFFPGSE